MSGLEKTTHICLIAVSLAALTLLVEKRFVVHRQPWAARATLVGKSVALTGATWSRSPKNVVIALKSTCKYCAQSMPLFRQIGGARATHGAGVSVIAVSPEPVETTREYLGKAEVTVDQILQYPLERMGIMGTPTVLVVDAHGVVRKEFDGTFSQADQKQLLAMLSAPAGAP